MSRIAPLVKKLIGTEDADDLMLEILEALTETTSSPEAGKFYTFVKQLSNRRRRHYIVGKFISENEAEGGLQAIVI